MSPPHSRPSKSTGRPWLIVGLWALCGCSATTLEAGHDQLNQEYVIIKEGQFMLARAGRNGRQSASRPFVPWGYNYDRTVVNGRDVLLEDALREQPQKVARDLATMRAMGGNVARVFVATTDILDGPEKPSPEGLRKLGLLLDATRRSGMRLILVGLANLRPDTAPAWLQKADDATMNVIQLTFWQTVARQCRGEPTVFAYDLQNEPAVPWNDTEPWVIGCFDMSGGQNFCYVHYLCRQMAMQWTQYIHKRFTDQAALRRHWPDYPRSGESWTAIAIPKQDPKDPRYGEYFGLHAELMATWADRLAGAIRAEDPGHLITVGALNPPAFARTVDFHSFHLYPERVPAGQDFLALNRDRWRQRMTEVPDRKPVVIEEFYPMVVPQGITFQQALDAMLTATRPRASGWVSFYWGPAAELNWPTPMMHPMYENWLKVWNETGRRESPPADHER
ncbi:MAG TPA: hypothetical protein PKY77_06055 [Phycisphaerae bacterium]|nr:hypothetical protein [Phycisphaerae bacterium]HRY68991.1 hypothetical protein [Phycisphaerae bacterium]HSA26035.1 hypothetical protein [Phycisphaerae bacterium]